jgi:hypothetical protein
MRRPLEAPFTPNRARIVVGMVVSSVLLVGSLAYAQSSVSVEVRTPANTPAEGRVSLTPDGASAPTHTCETHAGSCTMAGVPGGRYVVRLVPADGSAPPEPRVVVIPPAGTATLRVSTH